MRLTNQMKAEIDSMYDRSRAINRWYVADFEKTFECMYTEYIKELSTHKVKLENLLCETDLKEQGHSINSDSVLINHTESLSMIH